MNEEAIADFHCDLLSYLAVSDQRTPYDTVVRCAIPQLRAGNVKIQTLAIFSETKPYSSEMGLKQAQIFHDLPQLYPDEFYHASSTPINDGMRKIAIYAAIENASAVIEEIDSLDEGIKKFNRILQLTTPLIYVSLTWNTENRFGGGAHTSIGLKEDGKWLLERLSQHHIALDISHASDQLASEALNYIDKQNLPISLMASHSNMRSVTNVQRNLPDELVKEVINRKGLIGFNLFQPFIGMDKPDNILLHFEHLFGLGGIKQGGFGADFFYPDDFTPSALAPRDKYFFANYSNASCYPQILTLLKNSFKLTVDEMKGIALNNFFKFVKNRSID